MIPLSVPNLAGNEWKYIKECLDTNWVSSVGSFVDRFEKSLVDFTGAKYAVSVVNGTAALHVSLMLSGVEKGDYVIVPNITFIASVNSIKYVDAKPILIDVQGQNWQMDLDLLEEFLNEKTDVINGNCILKSTKGRVKAVMPVHVLGNMCDMSRLVRLAEKFNLVVIEDATESLGSYYGDRHSGTLGTFGCFSFNGNKIITTGGGGMIVTNDEHLAKKAKHLTTQAKSDPFEYKHDEVGYNYRLVNVLAAMGVAQMELLPDFLNRKKQIALAYKTAFSGISEVATQEIDEKVTPNNWLYTITYSRQKDLMLHLAANEIQVRPIWVPMNQLSMFDKDIYVSKQDVSDKVYRGSISLPCSTGMKDDEVEFVISKVKSFLTGKN
jgi:perosamine synthetase